jgi:hypothetical protein
MDHLSLANQFNTFAFEVKDNCTSINSEITSLQNDEFFRRIIFSRYYYALYHKFLAYNGELASKTGPGLHEILLRKVQAYSDPKLYQTFIKLRNLRIWADYKDNDPSALRVNLNTINADVYSIIKRTTIN